MLESIDKSLSELLKKLANQTKVWFLSYIDSKKHIFRDSTLMGLHPLYHCNYVTRLVLHWCIKCKASVFNEGFYALFSLHIGCHTFNTRANRVVIVCSVIIKIFNPMQVLDSHI
jgi:hypothetical protein